MSDAVTTSPARRRSSAWKGQQWYDSFQVLTDINLSVRPGERIVIRPSGSGKVHADSLHQPAGDGAGPPMALT